MNRTSNDANPQRLMPAAITESAAALYLDLRSAELQPALMSGSSLADVAELRGRSLSELKRALLEALQRMRVCTTAIATPVDRVVEFAERDRQLWQEAVAQLIVGPDGREQVIELAA